ncbi:MAG: glycosyltransferase family 9 protein [Candidatus Eremiobacterota bacterium]
MKPLPEKFKPKRIVIAISKGMGVGDLILATPLFRAIKTSCPDSYLAVLTTSYGGKILYGNPCIDEILLDNKKGTLKRILHIWNMLGKGNFDLSIHICSRTEDVIASCLSDIKVRVGPVTGFLHDYLLNYRFKSDLNGWTDRSHRIEYLLEYWRVLGYNTEMKKKLELYFPFSAEEKITREMKHEGSFGAKPLIIIHPGFIPPLRHFPVEFYLKLGKVLIKELKAYLIITGIKDEYDMTGILIDTFKPAVFNWVGRTDMGELCALISKSDLVITHDTGPLHMSAALGIPSVALFGPKSAYARLWGPYGVPHVIVESGTPDDCQTCEGKNKCKGNFDCKREISVDKVLEGARKLLRV